MEEGKIIHIADQLLQNLEREYWEIQKYNLAQAQINPQSLTSSNQEGVNQLNLNAQIEDPQADEEVGGYQRLGMDEDQQQLDEEESEREDEEQAGEVQKQINGQYEQKESNTAGIAVEVEQKMELILVEPTPEWVAPQKHVQIQTNKIKSWALGLNLEMPSWMQNEEELAKRVHELFGGRK